RISAPGKVVVEGKDGAKTVEAKNIIVATGARARSLPGLEPDGEYILTSREALSITKLPESMVVIGAGAIGVEFASIFNTFGVKVTIVEAMERILTLEEPEISQELTKLFKKQGIDVLTGAMVKSVDKGKAGVTVKVEVGGKEQELKAGQVLVA